MDELFKQIIIGEKDLKELDNNNSNMSQKVKNTNEVVYISLFIIIFFPSLV